MKMIVGLGNPSMEYVGTRHNVGFATIDKLVDTFKIPMNHNKLKAVYGTGVIGSEKVVVVKPMTYMNLSGEAVGALASYYKIVPEDIIVIFDDISLDVGQLRIRAKGSAGGHNGIKSIILHLKSEAFPRIKVGVGEKKPGQDLAKHVLGHFNKEEQVKVEDAMEDAVNAVNVMLEEGIDKAMNRYNGKK